MFTGISLQTFEGDLRFDLVSSYNTDVVSRVAYVQGTWFASVKECYNTEAYSAFMFIDGVKMITINMTVT